jgi:hypothetical protein
MERRSLNIALVVGFTISAVVVAGNASAHPTPNAGPSNGPPSAAFSTSGDYATDVLGDPWDFANDEDVPSGPANGVLGTEGSFGLTRTDVGNENAGAMILDGRNGSLIKLVRTWGAILPWGRDGLLKPIDAAIYTRLSFRIHLEAPRDFGVRYFTESGQINDIFLFGLSAGWNTYEIDLTQPGRSGLRLWSGNIVRLDLLAGGGAVDRFTAQLDWVRLHRSDAPTTFPPANAPIVRVITPSEVGGADYATVSGDAWDFAGSDDVLSTGDITSGRIEVGSYNGTTFANDSFVELPLRTSLNPDRYHRATVDVCYDGGFSLADAPGGGMNARFAWFDEGGQTWSETQDIVIHPGCNKMTFDLATDPAAAVNDESTVYKAGWRGLRITRLRFDLNEDRGARGFALGDIHLADDAALSLGTYPISFSSTATGTAHIFVTTERGSWKGIEVGSMPAREGANTFPWDGAGRPNGTYWVYVVVDSGNSVGSSYSSGPVRIERPVGPTQSCYVPLNPFRVLDTRTGQGGNVSALTTAAQTEVKVTAIGGVPPTGATAVVLNVTVADPTASGYITAWPSGEGQPTVSNLNYVAGQNVPNLVTVKVGANGRVDMFNSQGNTNVIADVVGYYTALTTGCTGRFTAVTPGRVLDTRNGTGQGGSTSPVGAGQAINVTVTGLMNVPPTGVSGVALNVTADSPTAEGYLTVWPTGEPPPGASSHNFVPGLTVANLVLAKVGAGGQVSIFNSAGSTHVVADVVGYFSDSPAGGTFVPLSPQRIVDSRDGTGGVNGQLSPQQTVNFAVAGIAGVPTNATAAIVNVTSTDSTAPSFITVWPGAAMPTASTVNPRPGVAVPNLAYVKLGSGGRLSLYNDAGSTNVIVDLFGYVV